jgi:hypothetical protein
MARVSQRRHPPRSPAADLRRPRRRFGVYADAAPSHRIDLDGMRSTEPRARDDRGSGPPTLHPAIARPPALTDALADPDAEDRYAFRVIWLMVAATVIATVITYWRLPPELTYDFTKSGIAGGLSRSVTYLGFPVSLIALGALATRGRADPIGLIAAALCSTALPFASSDLVAHAYDLPAVAGVALAAWLTTRGPSARPSGLTGARIAVLALLALLALPWLIAMWGLYAQDVPLLGHVIRARQPTPGDPLHVSVHLGLHEGLYGAQLAAAAVLATLRRRTWPVSLLWSLLFVYGLGVALEDGWHEQVVKRGMTTTRLPGVLHPTIGLPWLALLGCAVLVHLAWFGRPRPPSTGRAGGT